MFQDSETSESVQVACGLRQGCPLSPILFIMFINPLIKLLKRIGGVRVQGLCDGGTCNIDVSNL